MDFKKKFNHDDINLYLPDNITAGTAEFYQNKFGDKFPDYFYNIFEIMARAEYNEEETTILIDKINNDMQTENQKLISEWNDRQNEIGQVFENLDKAITIIDNKIDNLTKYVVKIDDDSNFPVEF